MEILVISFSAFRSLAELWAGADIWLLSLCASNPIICAASIEPLVARYRLALTHRGPIVPLASRAYLDKAASIKYSLIEG